MQCNVEQLHPLPLQFQRNSPVDAVACSNPGLSLVLHVNIQSYDDAIRNRPVIGHRRPGCGLSRSARNALNDLEGATKDSSDADLPFCPPAHQFEDEAIPRPGRRLCGAKSRALVGSNRSGRCVQTRPSFPAMRSGRPRTPFPTTEGVSNMSSLERPSAAIVRDSPGLPQGDRQQVEDCEAVELHRLQTQEDNELEYTSPSASSGDEYRLATRRTVSRTTVQSSTRNASGPWRRFCRFWTHHVTLTVPQKSNRDHLALERTFLAYIRTSVVIAMQGVVIAQLYRLQRSPTKEDRLKFFEVGIPLAVACYAVAVLVALIGAYRFWRQQSAISRGKVHAGGWELNSVGIFLFCIILVTLVISVAIIVEINESPGTLIRRILS